MGRSSSSDGSTSPRTLTCSPFCNITRSRLRGEGFLLLAMQQHQQQHLPLLLRLHPVDPRPQTIWSKWHWGGLSPFHSFTPSSLGFWPLAFSSFSIYPPTPTSMLDESVLLDTCIMCGAFVEADSGPQRSAPLVSPLFCFLPINLHSSLSLSLSPLPPHLRGCAAVSSMCAALLNDYLALQDCFNSPYSMLPEKIIHALAFMIHVSRRGTLLVVLSQVPSTPFQSLACLAALSLSVSLGACRRAMIDR